DLDKLKRFFQSKHASPSGKVTMQRKIIGICDDCGIISDYNVIRYYDGVTRIERYCAKCLEQQKDSGKIKVNEST
ncbi:MAG: hypothetical protein WB511_07855, partial [Nitrososphaeraceae archaeon]